MGRSLLFGAVLCAVLLVAATTRSDDAGLNQTDETTTLPPETIAGTAVQPAPSDDPPPKDLFEPYGVGGPEAIWPYDALTSDEKTIVDRGRSVTGWSGIHSAYSAGVALQSIEARAAAAQHRLGIESTEVGVVQ
jgi:hypothetical protein